MSAATAVPDLIVAVGKTGGSYRKRTFNSFYSLVQHHLMYDKLPASVRIGQDIAVPPSWKKLFSSFCFLPILFGMAQMTPTRGTAQDLPPQVMRLKSAVEAIPGIASVEITRIYLPDIALSDLSLLGPYADLPSAALRRSGGGLPDESLLSINFEIAGSGSGLKGLEFLAWWARDQVRTGKNIQLRVNALPPMVGDTVQLGSTLHFTIDWFYANPSQDMGVLLAAMDDAAASIEAFMSLYQKAFQ